MITASIVTFHTPEKELERLIECVLHSPVSKLFIIDNSRDEGTKKLAVRKDKSLDIEYIGSDNIGYGSAHNIGMRKALDEGADYHIILNPDVYWDDDVISKLRDFMDSNRDCGLVMPYVAYPDGSNQYLCKLLPTPFDLIGRRFIPFRKYQEVHDYEYEMHWFGYDKIAEIPCLSGCFMFLRCSVLKKTGGFDERFFMYAEDMDLCRRIGEISKTMFYPHVKIVHEYDKGSYKSKKLLKYHILSLIKYFNKWGWIFDSRRKQLNSRIKIALNHKN